MRCRGGRGAARQRPPGREDGLGDLRARGRMELHRRRPLRLAPAAGEPDRRADGAARLRVVPLGPELRRLAARVLARVRARGAVGRRLPAADHGLPVGPARARARPRAGDRGLPDLHRGVDPGHVLRGSARARMRRLPDQCAADPPRPRSRARRDRVPGPALHRPVRHRARPPDPALAAQRSARAAAAHPGLRVRPAHLPAGDGGDGGRGRRRARGRCSSPPRCCPSPFWPACCAATSRGWTPTCAPAVVELRASRARLVEAGDTERRRLERNLHDGAQARLVGLALLLGHARRRVDTDPVETASCSTARWSSSGEPRRAARAGARDPPRGADRARTRTGAATRSPPARRCP